MAAKTIGVSEADLMTARRSGRSIADVAKSENVEVQKLTALPHRSSAQPSREC